MNIKEFMSQDHKDCDLLFSKAENAVAGGDWLVARQSFNTFVDAMNRHFSVEEEALFPAFEKETGMLSAPTEIMRMEHEQMRMLFAEMHEALAQQDTDDYLGTAETLLIMMQQHNMKEEQILYNMMNQLLPADANQWQEKFHAWGKR